MVNVEGGNCYDQVDKMDQDLDVSAVYSLHDSSGQAIGEESSSFLQARSVSGAVREVMTGLNARLS